LRSYIHVVDEHSAPLDPNFTAAGRTETDAGSYCKVHRDQVTTCSRGSSREDGTTRNFQATALEKVVSWRIERVRN